MLTAIIVTTTNNHNNNSYYYYKYKINITAANGIA